MNDTLIEVLRLVFSSTRAMPAHFTSNGKRKKSFCVDFEPLSEEVDYEMASESWNSIDNFLGTTNCGNEILSKNQVNIVIKCGEDLMVGAFILTKLSGYSLIVDMKKEIIDNTIETFTEMDKNLLAVLAGSQVNKYFDHCIKYGHSMAV